MQVRSEDIYEALFDDDAFARLPDILAKAANARSALLFWRHHDGLSETMAFNYFPPAMIQSYGAQWAVADPWVIGGERSGRVNEMVLLEQYVPSATFERTVFYNDFIRKHDDDTFYCTGAIIKSASGQGVISAQRGRTSKPFDAADVRRLNRAATHVDRVLRTRGEIASARRATALTQDALDTVGLVAITVRADGRLLNKNHAAETILRKAETLVARSGFLSAAHPDNDARLTAGICAATDAEEPRATAVTLKRGPDRSAYLVTIAPLVRRGGASAALVLFRDPDGSDNSLPDRLRAQFNLSAAEAAICVDLMQGCDLSAICRARNVKISTLRAQLRSIGAKTGCGRQSELVALLATLPPLA